MAWRLDKHIIRGIIDNRVRGRVTGEIWLTDRQEPLRLDLIGNGHRDLAGCKLVFLNRNPQSTTPLELQTLQRGLVGDITASRKVRIFDVPPEEAMRLMKAGKPVPEHTGNGLYVEWFSEQNGRVVIETTDLELAVSEPAWTMTTTEEQEQRRQNQQAVRDWLDRLSAVDDDDEPYDPADERPMDEFEWEQFLRESDALTEKYSHALDKYKDHPDCDKLVAREMEWTWLEEALEAEERGALESDEFLEDDEEEDEEFDPLEPNPLTEGVDWIRDEHGHVRHPLTHHAKRVAMAIWYRCDELDLLGEHGDEDVQEMVFQAQTLSAKLAGALDHLAYDTEPEPGFMIACLKRALTYVHGVISASEQVAGKALIEELTLQKFRVNMFEVREEILALMTRFRERPW